MLVTLAGPMSNLLLSVLLTIILKILISFNVIDYAITTASGGVLTTMFMTLIEFNVVFGIFNLIPIPPLDGSKILFYFLPNKYKHIMYTLEKYSFYIIIIFWFTGLTSIIISPIVSLIIRFLNFILTL